MASFKDKDGRAWELQICGPTIDLVREEVDPLFLLDDDTKEVNTSNRLNNDPALLCHVIYLLCRKQCEKREVTLDDFYSQVIGSGETIEAAGEALAAAIVNFTPPKKRAFIQAVAAKQKAVEELAMAKAMAALNDPALEAKILASIDEAIAKALTPPTGATDLPGTAESGPKA